MESVDIDAQNSVKLVFDPINKKMAVLSPENGREMIEGDMMIYGLFHLLVNSDKDDSIWKLIDEGTEQYLLAKIEEKGMTLEEFEQQMNEAKTENG